MALQEIDGDPSSIATELRTRIVCAGLAYDRTQPPHVLQHSTQHETWRISALSCLRAWDRVAASVDGKPPMVTECMDPRANAELIKRRLIAAAASAKPAVAALISVLLRSPLPTEPPEFVSGYDAARSVAEQPMGESERALLTALADLNAYLAHRAVGTPATSSTPEQK